jgi:hypothetical protein
MNTELPRLLRPQPREFFTDPDMLAMLDTDNNIVHYRKDIADTMTDEECKAIMFLRDKYLYITPATTGFI